MKEYWYENGFGNQSTDEDNKGTVYDSEDLNEVASWKIDEIGFM